MDELPDRDEPEPEAESGPELPGSVGEWAVCLAIFVGVLLAFFLLLFGPGVAVRAAEGTTHYSWSIWACLGPFLLALGCLGSGVLLVRSQKFRVAARWLLWMAMIVGVSGLTFGGIGFLMPADYGVTVAADHFENVHGDFGTPTRTHVRFDELSALQVESHWSIGVRRGYPYPSHEGDLLLTWKTGQQEKIVVGGLLEHAVPEIVERARKKGVRIVE
jgi:hypothetical protein